MEDVENEKYQKPSTNIKKSLSILFNIENPIGRKFRLTIQGLIILSILLFSIETLPNLPVWVKSSLYVCEIIIISIFTLEYMIHIYISENKRKFVFSFYGIVDLLTILPFYLSLLSLTGLDLRFLRMLRLIRLLKLFEHSKTIKRFSRAIASIKYDLLLFSAITIGILFFSAIVMYFCERNAQPEVFASVFHSLWWSIVTLTTVGYGDVYPVTLLGRMMTFLLLILGLAIVSIPAGLIASALSNNKEE
ncbi:MAG: ion transporter [Thalassotalea sp.]